MSFDEAGSDINFILTVDGEKRKIEILVIISNTVQSFQMVIHASVGSIQFTRGKLQPR